MEAHHFCTHISKDFHQCVIYDSDKPEARLIGIEYIVSEKVCLEDIKLLLHVRLTSY